MEPLWSFSQNLNSVNLRYIRFSFLLCKVTTICSRCFEAILYHGYDDMSLNCQLYVFSRYFTV